MTDKATDPISLARRRAIGLLEGYGYTHGDEIAAEHWTEAALEVLATAENFDAHWFDEFLHPTGDDRLGLSVSLRIHARLLGKGSSAAAVHVAETLLTWARSWADHVVREAAQQLPVPS